MRTASPKRCVCDVSPAGEGGGDRDVRALWLLQLRHHQHHARLLRRHRSGQTQYGGSDSLTALNSLVSTCAAGTNAFLLQFVREQPTGARPDFLLNELNIFSRRDPATPTSRRSRDDQKRHVMTFERRARGGART